LIIASNAFIKLKCRTGSTTALMTATHISSRFASLHELNKITLARTNSSFQPEKKIDDNQYLVEFQTSYKAIKHKELRGKIRI